MIMKSSLYVEKKSSQKLRPFSKNFRIQIGYLYNPLSKKRKYHYHFFARKYGWSKFYYRYSENYKNFLKTFFLKPYKYLKERTHLNQRSVFERYQLLKFTKNVFLKFFKFRLKKIFPSSRNFYYLNYKQIKLRSLTVSNRIKSYKKLRFTWPERVLKFFKRFGKRGRMYRWKRRRRNWNQYKRSYVNKSKGGYVNKSELYKEYRKRKMFWKNTFRYFRRKYGKKDSSNMSLRKGFRIYKTYLMHKKAFGNTIGRSLFKKLRSKGKNNRKIKNNTNLKIKATIRNFWLRGYYRRFCLQFIDFSRKNYLYKKIRYHFKFFKKKLENKTFNIFSIFYYYQLYLLKIFTKSKLTKFNNSSFLVNNKNKKVVVCLSSVKYLKYIKYSKYIMTYIYLLRQKKNEYKRNLLKKNPYLSNSNLNFTLIKMRNKILNFQDKANKVSHSFKKNNVYHLSSRATKAIAPLRKKLFLDKKKNKKYTKEILETCKNFFFLIENKILSKKFLKSSLGEYFFNYDIFFEYYNKYRKSLEKIKKIFNKSKEIEKIKKIKKSIKEIMKEMKNVFEIRSKIKTSKNDFISFMGRRRISDYFNYLKNIMKKKYDFLLFSNKFFKELKNIINYKRKKVLNNFIYKTNKIYKNKIKLIEKGVYESSLTVNKLNEMLIKKKKFIKLKINRKFNKVYKIKIKEINIKKDKVINIQKIFPKNFLNYIFNINFDKKLKKYRNKKIQKINKFYEKIYSRKPRTNKDFMKPRVELVVNKNKGTLNKVMKLNPHILRYYFNNVINKKELLLIFLRNNLKKVKEHKKIFTNKIKKNRSLLISNYINQKKHEISISIFKKLEKFKKLGKDSFNKINNIFVDNKSINKILYNEGRKIIKKRLFKLNKFKKKELFKYFLQKPEVASKFVVERFLIEFSFYKKFFSFKERHILYKKWKGSIIKIIKELFVEEYMIKRLLKIKKKKMLIDLFSKRSVINVKTLFYSFISETTNTDKFLVKPFKFLAKIDFKYSKKLFFYSKYQPNLNLMYATYYKIFSKLNFYKNQDEKIFFYFKRWLNVLIRVNSFRTKYLQQGFQAFKRGFFFFNYSVNFYLFFKLNYLFINHFFYIIHQKFRKLSSILHLKGFEFSYDLIKWRDNTRYDVGINPRLFVKTFNNRIKKGLKL